VEAGADLLQLGDTLEHRDAESALQQGQRRGEPADTGARDQYVRFHAGILAAPHAGYI